MLNRLLIRNYAIIDEVDIQFTEKLNIITGETGAGKSILVGALGLVLGDRADTSVLQDKNNKAVVEAFFSGNDQSQIRQLLQQWDIDFDAEIILRREISASGKSRAFINDTPVNLNQLQQLANLLVDLHQQFDTHLLGDDDFQLNVLDSLASNQKIRSDFHVAFKTFDQLRKTVQALKDKQATANKELDYNSFLLDELVQADFKPDEMEKLELELKTLSHAEQIRSILTRVNFMLRESEQPVVQQVRAAVQQLGSVNSFHPDLPQLAERLQSSYIELQDICSELEQLGDKIQMDPARIDEVQQRISLGQKLCKKHHVSGTAELILVRKGLDELVSEIVSAGDDIQKLEKEMKTASDAAHALAQELQKTRKKQVPVLEKRVAELLKRIGMPNAGLKVDMQDAALYAGGIDQVSLLFDANKTGRYERLEKVASGGELSRLMLSLKSLMAHSVKMPTLIFDEIDSGISGEAARQVGMLMKELGLEHQVISITHQPQIAARADAHYYVFKKDQRGQIKTQITRLSDDERIEAIARMLGGETPSALVIENAREMVGAK